ncbi:hypothetical protein IM697_23635 [Streptomyces ferrugineus]|uniref:TniQ protein n=1 Tax=Streptomyces ferrugineus TaxID=1413221 RepID=A0A7M2SB53_9ACTN|nr:hypothetical protein [Streptomyces ferrugineus]QOV33239.1 hypothetical protein IM697_23635 [Streptomyces ferrugineus]
MTAARTPRSTTGRARRTKRWKPARRLGLSVVPFIGGESTGSYTRRLADLNGIPDEEFWLMFGTPLRQDGVVGDPLCGDGYLNRAALERLAVMAHRPVAQLQFALPNLREHRLLEDKGPPAWDWPWDTTGCFLVRVCELCAQNKRTRLEAYLASDATWQVCVAHGRWLDNRREPGAAAIALTALPEVVNAHRRRLYLERRLGPGGRAMFADAYALTSCWWNIPALNAPVWQARRRVLGRAGRDELRVAPLLFYPEAVRLAEALAARERRRLRYTLTPQEDGCWLEQVALLLDEWGIPVAEALELVSIWASRHPLLPRPRRAGPSATQRPARGRYRRLPMAGPHTDESLQATLGERSCLPWQLGEMITTELAPAPGGWRLGGRA